MSETKTKYFVEFGIAPHIKQLLLTDLDGSPFTFKFDETTTSQVKKQYDAYFIAGNHTPGVEILGGQDQEEEIIGDGGHTSPPRSEDVHENNINNSQTIPCGWGEKWSEKKTSSSGNCLMKHFKEYAHNQEDEENPMCCSCTP